MTLKEVTYLHLRVATLIFLTFIYRQRGILSLRVDPHYWRMSTKHRVPVESTVSSCSSERK